MPRDEPELWAGERAVLGARLDLLRGNAVSASERLRAYLSRFGIELQSTAADRMLERFGRSHLDIARGEVLGLLAIVYTMVNYVRDRASAEEWMLGVGFCLLFGAAVASQVQGVLLGHRARIETLEKRAAADANRPADGTPS